jgi:signal transduction histidine kinase
VLTAYVDGPAVVVVVRNQGDPIPPKVLPFIFEPFRRAKQREKSPTGNLGLGLYIASQIALSHGGSLEAVSSEGTTDFVMRVPRVGPADRAGAATDPAAAPVH